MLKNKKNPLFIFLFLAALSYGASAFASATVKTSPAPVYNPTEPIPVSVGLVVSEGPGVQSRGTKKTAANDPYGPKIARELQKLKVFRDIVYPYKKGALSRRVDAVLLLEIKGRWEYYNGQRQPYDTWAASTPSHYAQGTHEVKVIMTASGRRIINGSISVKSRSRYSGQDYGLIARRLNEVQAGKIALTLANFLQGRQDHIMARTGGAPYGAAAEKRKSAAQPEAGLSNAVSPVVEKGKTGKPHPATKGETAGRLKALEELHASGALSDSDFGKARTRLLQLRKLKDLYKSGVLSRREYQRGMARIKGKQGKVK